MVGVALISVVAGLSGAVWAVIAGHPLLAILVGPLMGSLAGVLAAASLARRGDIPEETDLSDAPAEVLLRRQIGFELRRRYQDILTERVPDGMAVLLRKMQAGDAARA
jgi:hypothetical protein